MKKRIIIFLSIFLVLSMATVYAGNSLYGYFKDYEKVRILVDGEELDSTIPAFIIDNTTVIPLRSVSEKLNIIVKWNEETKTADLIKPNVNMQFTVNPVDSEDVIVYYPFGKIPKNQRHQFGFYVYSEIDNLPNEQVEIKLVLKDPDGYIVREGETHLYDALNETSLQYIDKFGIKNKDKDDDNINNAPIEFVKSGNYSVELLLKSESTEDKFIIIGEKLIYVE